MKKALATVGDRVAAKYRPGKVRNARSSSPPLRLSAADSRAESLSQSDVFEVNLSVVVQDATLALAEDLHDCREGLLLHTPEIQVSLRLHDFFMGQ